MKWLVYVTLVMISWLWLAVTPVQAATLRIQPLEYQTTLKPGNVQQGHVDITNPSDDTVQVTMSVQAFRQIDNQGTLQFYDNKAVTAGVQPDITEFTLKPGETIRLFFTVDGSKLPSGDVFAALFATTRPADKTAGVAQTVRVGTLLTIVNGTPGSRQAVIADISVPFWQFGDGVQGTYTITNTADPTTTTGFYPTVDLAVEPFPTTKQQKSTLVYAGISRTNDFSIDSERFGLYKVSASYGDSTTSQWVFMATGMWRWIGLALVIAVAVAALIVGRWLFRRYRNRKKA